jgi:hypothetical protein
MKVTFNTGSLRKLDARLGRIDQQTVNAANTRAVNQVTQRTFNTARRQMIAGINLPDSYLRERMAIDLATTGQKPTAHIRARYAHTGLGRYAPRVITRSTLTTGRGDASRGIAPGLKSAGVSVEVTRGQRKPIENAFIMPLKNGNGLGVFVRDPGRRSPRLLFGPSVYQLFRATIGRIDGDIRADLELTVMVGLSRLVQDAVT